MDEIPADNSLCRLLICGDALCVEVVRARRNGPAMNRYAGRDLNKATCHKAKAKAKAKVLYHKAKVKAKAWNYKAKAWTARPRPTCQGQGQGQGRTSQDMHHFFQSVAMGII